MVQARRRTVGKVLADGKTIGWAKMFGYVMRAAPGNSAVTDFMPLLWAFGGDIRCQGKRSGVPGSG
jgi:hypothetical protein